MLSMTGFGRGEAVYLEKTVVRAEINSVNRKQLEIKCSLPSNLSHHEMAIRKIVQNSINRGAVQVKITVLKQGSSLSGNFNEKLLVELTNLAKSVRHECGLDENVNVETLMQTSVALAGDTEVDDDEEFLATCDKALSVAVENLRHSRQVEGENLLKDLSKRGVCLKKLLEKIEVEVKNYPAQAREKLLEKLKNAKLDIQENSPELLREILFYTDRADVTEEITRLKSHFSQLDKFLESTVPCGRNLDFLTQEFFREITTLGNKAASPTVSPLTVEFKSELEKMREQIQNVE